MEIELIPYRKGDKWGFCTPDKKVDIDCIYSEVKTFKEGVAAVWGSDYVDGIWGIPHWGYIDKSGNVVITSDQYGNLFDYAESFCEGMARVRIYEEWRFINKSGEYVIQDTDKYKAPEGFLPSVNTFSEGLAWIIVSNEYGYVDKSGANIIPCMYERALDFSEELAAVKLNNKWGFINKYREVVIEFIYEFNHDYIPFDWNLENKRYFHFLNGLAYVSYKGFYGYIDKKGTQYWED